MKAILWCLLMISISLQVAHSEGQGEIRWGSQCGLTDERIREGDEVEGNQVVVRWVEIGSIPRELFYEDESKVSDTTKSQVTLTAQVFAKRRRPPLEIVNLATALEFLDRRGDLLITDYRIHELNFTEVTYAPGGEVDEGLIFEQGSTKPVALLNGDSMLECL